MRSGAKDHVTAGQVLLRCGRQYVDQMIEVFSRRNASNVLPVTWPLGELEILHIRRNVGERTRVSRYEPKRSDSHIPGWQFRSLGIECDRPLLVQTARSCRVAAASQGRGMCTRGSMDGLYPAYIALFWAIVRTEPAAREAARIATEDALTILDDQLSKAGVVIGDGLTMADVPFGALAYRYLNLEIDRP
jgi:glutathione S-transferase